MSFLCFHPQTISSCAAISWYHGNHGSSSNDNNGRVFTAFPTSNWNTVDLIVTSFQAPDSNFQVNETHHYMIMLCENKRVCGVDSPSNTWQTTRHGFSASMTKSMSSRIKEWERVAGVFISPHSPRSPVVAAATKRNIRGTVRQNPGTPWMPHGDAANMLAWGLFVAKRLVFFIRRLKAAKVDSFFISSRKAAPLKACSHLPLKWHSLFNFYIQREHQQP